MKLELVMTMHLRVSTEIVLLSEWSFSVIIQKE